MGMADMPLDAMIAEARTVLDPAKRQPLYGDPKPHRRPGLCAGHLPVSAALGGWWI